MAGSGQPFTRDVLDALSLQLAVLDQNGTIVLVNEAWLRFAAGNGGSPDREAHLGGNYLAVCRAAARAGDAVAADVAAGIEDVLAGRRETLLLEYPCHSPDRERWFQMRVTTFQAAAGRHLVVAHEDITARWTSQRALEASERLLRSVLEALPVGVWVQDASGRIVHGNSAGVRIWSGARFVGPDEFGQYRGWWLATGEPIAAEDWAAARAIRHGETSIDEEVEIECFDTTHKIIANSAVPLRDDQGRIAGAIIVNQDITGRKRAEGEREALLREQERLHRAALEANRTKDEFIAMLSHELRTPLQGVLGWGRTLQRLLPEGHEGRRAVEAIERNARVQLQLLDDTLDMSRIARGTVALEPADVDLAGLVGEVVETMRPSAAEKGLTLTAHLHGTGTMVHGDPTRLQQVVWNLLGNAVKFTPRGGHVEVHTRAEGGWVELAVRDDGAGIPSEFMPFLFDRFSQCAGAVPRTRIGRGLGLAIVKELVERHRGTVKAESAGAGRGATFIVRLPSVEAAGDARPLAVGR